MMCKLIFLAALNWTCLGQSQVAVDSAKVVPITNVNAIRLQPRVPLDRRPAAAAEAVLRSRRINDRFLPPVAAETAIQPVMAKSLLRLTNSALRSASTKVISTNQWMRSAEVFQARGDMTNALRSLESAEVEAQRTGDRQTAGIAALNSARILQTSMALKAVRPAQTKQIIDKYRIAVAEAPPAQQALARNNLATLYVKEKQYGEAVTVLRNMNWQAVDPTQTYLCRYNLGRAEELNGDLSGALQQYQLALQQRPNYAPAVDGAFRLYIRSTNAESAASLAEELIRQGEVQAAVRNLQRALEQMPPATHAPLLLTALTRGYTAQRLTPSAFSQSVRPWLQRVADQAPPIQPLITELNRAFAGDFKPVFDTSYATMQLKAWSQTAAQREALSKLLKNIGDYYSRSDAETPAQPERALACYTVAWMFDLANTDAALYATALLHEHPAQLDRNGERLNALTELLFHAKGELYGIPIKTRQDWLNLMHLHLVLATIYEKKPIWGPEDRVDSALFQLSHAAKIEELLQKDDPAFVPSPDLYSRLARAFKENSRNPEAWAQYVRAAEGFAYFHQAPKSERALSDADALRVTLNGEQRAHLEAVRKTVAQLASAPTN